jgi:hypothetical protein
MDENKLLKNEINTLEREKLSLKNGVKLLGNALNRP